MGDIRSTPATDAMGDRVVISPEDKARMITVLGQLIDLVQQSRIDACNRGDVERLMEFTKRREQLQELHRCLSRKEVASATDAHDDQGGTSDDMTL